jgi:hypothetical protein
MVYDIDPGSIKKFHFTFLTPKGEKVGNYALTVGEMIEQQ